MKKIKRVLRESLQQAGQIIRVAFPKKKNAQYKGEIDIVTETDKKAEHTIIQTIHRHFPEHTILAEESDAPTHIGTYKWIIDPIDGTTNFFHAYPHVATSIALEKDGVIIMGGVYNPVRDELFFAERGHGAFLNKKRITVSSTKKLADSLLATGFPYDRRTYPEYYLSFFRAFMMSCHGIRRSGTASLDLCYVASGRIDGFWEFKLHPWDTAAGSLIVEEAGGKMSSLVGRKFSIYGEETCASNGIIHTQMKQVLKKVRGEKLPWENTSIKKTKNQEARYKK